MSHCRPCRPAPRGGLPGGQGRGGTRGDAGGCGEAPAAARASPRAAGGRRDFLTLLKSKVSSACCLHRDRWEYQCQLATAPAGEVISIVLLRRQEWPKPSAEGYCRRHVMAPVSGGGLRGREDRLGADTTAPQPAWATWPCTPVTRPASSDILLPRQLRSLLTFPLYYPPKEILARYWQLQDGRLLLGLSRQNNSHTTSG